MKIIMGTNTIKKIEGVLKVFAKDTLSTIDFCTGVNGDEMANKLSVTDGTSQSEMSFVTKKDSGFDGEYSIEKPGLKVTFKTEDLLEALSRLAIFNRDVAVTAEKNALEFETVDKKAKLKVSLVDNATQKALIPTRYNSMKQDLFDPTAMFVRLNADAFLDAVRISSVFQDNFPVICVIKDEANKTAEVDGKQVLVSNASLQMYGTNANAIGSAKIDIGVQKMEKINDGGEIDFAEFIKNNFDCDYNESGLVLELKPEIVKELASYVAISNGCVDLMIGKKYFSASINGLDTIFTGPLAKNEKSYKAIYDENATKFVAKEKGCTVKSEEILNALKFTSVYDKDKTLGAKPCEVVLKDGVLSLTKGDSRMEVECKADDGFAFEYNVKNSYLASALSALAVEEVTFRLDGRNPMAVILPKDGAAETGFVVLGVKKN